MSKKVKKKNILLAINKLDIGGVGTFVLNLASALSKEYNVFLFQLYPHKADHNFIKSKLDVKAFRWLNFPNILDKILWWIDGRCERFLHWEKAKSYLFIRSILDPIFVNFIFLFFKIDFIHSNFFDVNYYLIHHSFPSMRPPVIIGMHGDYDFERNNEREKYIPNHTFQEFLIDTEKILNQVDRIIYCAEKNKWIASQINIRTQFQKIHHGYPRFEIEERNCIKTFGMHARGIQEKGWEILIKAFIKLQEEYPTIQLKLAYSIHEDIERLKIQYNANTNIVFEGEVTNVPDFLKTIDLGVLPTYFWVESLPNTIIEFMNSGIPTISTVLGDIPEMIKASNGDLAGQLIPLEVDGKPSVEKLYLAMKTYLEDEALYKYHCELAEDAFQKFDMDICVKKYKQLYNEIINTVNV